MAYVCDLHVQWNIIQLQKDFLKLVKEIVQLIEHSVFMPEVPD